MQRRKKLSPRDKGEQGKWDAIGPRGAAFLRPQWFGRNRYKFFGKYGGDDETRTRDLCRDRDRGDCQSTPKSSKTSHFVGWVVGWKLARSSEEFASAYATRAEHFFDRLWLDSADLHFVPHGSREGNWWERQDSNPWPPAPKVRAETLSSWFV